MKHVLIDSDICLDVFLQRHPFAEHSAKILVAAEQEKIKAFVSGIAFDNIYYVLRKNSDHKWALDRIKRLRELVEVGSVSKFTIDSALESSWKDFEDALQHYCALENNCKAIITRNSRDYRMSEIDIFNPQRFLKEME